MACLSDLGDLVVVGQEHGQVLRLLDGLRVGHLPQELGCPGGEEDRKHVLITKDNLKKKKINYILQMVRKYNLFNINQDDMSISTAKEIVLLLLHKWGECRNILRAVP